jgi:hypothetical protein
MTNNKIDKIVINLAKGIREETFALGSEGSNLERKPLLSEAKKQILELIVEAREETAKAYGGCTKCYGKGYATVRKGRSYRKNGIYKTWEMNDEMDYCTCDRGKQLAALKSTQPKTEVGGE